MNTFEDFYKLGEKIGDGNFAEVKICECTRTGCRYAAKIIKMKQKTVFGHYDINSRGMTPHEIEREVEILKSIDHHTIVKLHGTYERDDVSILLLELVAGGELFVRVAEFGQLAENESAIFIAQILQGIDHIHKLGIVHLDLKPENIMIEDMVTKRIKIIDFGLARRLNANETIQDMAGTPEFCAPEIVNFDPITYATDMWAIGVMTYILLSGISPFAGDSQVETFQNILECSVTFDREEFIEVSDEARDFIKRLLRKNPKKRASALECLRHTWIEPVIREITGHPQVIQKINLNGLLPSLSPNGIDHSPKSEAKKTKRTEVSVDKVTSLPNGMANSHSHANDAKKNGEVPLLSRKKVSENGASNPSSCPEPIKKPNHAIVNVNKRKSLSKMEVKDVSTEDGSSERLPSLQPPPENLLTENKVGRSAVDVVQKPGADEMHKHKVTTTGRRDSKHDITSRISSIRVTTESTKTPNVQVMPRVGGSGSTLLGRATKWLEATTNSAFERKLRIPQPCSSYSASFYRARNAFASKNTIAERKIMFTRVETDGDIQQALPGFRWRVLPNSASANSSSGAA